MTCATLRYIFMTVSTGFEYLPTNKTLHCGRTVGKAFPMLAFPGSHVKAHASLRHVTFFHPCWSCVVVITPELHKKNFTVSLIKAQKGSAPEGLKEQIQHFQVCLVDVEFGVPLRQTGNLSQHPVWVCHCPSCLCH